jgi:hypothetical protein
MRLVVVAALAALLLPAPAQGRARADRIKLPVPAAGDVTLARVLIATRPTARRGGGTARITLLGATPPAGTAVALVGEIQRFSGRRSLLDALIAVARPPQATGPGTNVVTLKLSARRARASLARILLEPNARQAGDANCQNVMPAAPRLSGRLLAGAWPGLSAQRIVAGALGDGCPSRGLFDRAFSDAFAGAIGNAFVTWARNDEGIVRLCVYVRDAPGVQGQVVVVSPRGRGGSAVYAVGPSGRALTTLDGWTSSVDVTIAPEGRDPLNDTISFDPAARAGPAVPSDLMAAGACDPPPLGTPGDIPGRSTRDPP